MPDAGGRIAIESVTSPGYTQHVDRTKYMAMREALLAVLPIGPTGVTVTEAKAALLPALPEDLVPGSAKAGWWLKAVQLDLEAKGVIGPEPVKPVRLFRISDSWEDEAVRSPPTSSQVVIDALGEGGEVHHRGA